jgi:hypothetical protein
MYIVTRTTPKLGRLIWCFDKGVHYWGSPKLDAAFIKKFGTEQEARRLARALITAEVEAA